MLLTALFQLPRLVNKNNLIAYIMKLSIELCGEVRWGKMGMSYHLLHMQYDIDAYSDRSGKDLPTFLDRKRMAFGAYYLEVTPRNPK